MKSPAQLLETYADTLEASGGDATAVRDAAIALSGFKAKTAKALTPKLRSIADALELRTSPARALEEMRDALSRLAALIKASGRSPPWLSAYIDILGRSDATSAEDLRQRFHETRGAATTRQSRTEPMATKADDDVAHALTVAIREEAACLDGGAAALAALDSKDLPKEAAIAIARELSGITYRSKKAAIDGIRGWYQSRRYSRRSIQKVSEAARRL